MKRALASMVIAVVVGVLTSVIFGQPAVGVLVAFLVFFLVVGGI